MNNKIIATAMVISIMLTACGQTENSTYNVTDESTAETTSQLSETSAESELAEIEELTETELTEAVTESNDTDTETELLLYDDGYNEVVGIDIYYYNYEYYNALLYSTSDYSYGNPDAPSPESFPDYSLIETAKKKLVGMEITSEYSPWTFDSIESSDCQCVYYYDFDNDGEKEALVGLSEAHLSEILGLYFVFVDGDDAYVLSEDLTAYEGFQLEKITVNDGRDLELPYQNTPYYYRLEGYPHTDLGYDVYEFRFDEYGFKIIKTTQITY